MSADKVIWLDRGLLPIYYGFCPSERAWKREMRRMKVKETYAYPSADGCCTIFENSEGHSLCIVTINEGKKRSVTTLHGILVHEGMHVWQRALDAMSEKEPSTEFEAYACQHIFLELCSAYDKTRGQNAKRILRKCRAGKPVSRSPRKRGMGRGS